MQADQLFPMGQEEQSQNEQNARSSPGKRKAGMQLAGKPAKRRKPAAAAQHAQPHEKLWPVLVRGVAQLVAALKTQG